MRDARVRVHFAAVGGKNQGGQSEEKMRSTIADKVTGRGQLKTPPPQRVKTGCKIIPGHQHQ